MPKKSQSSFDYTEKSGELEAVLQRLQSGEVPLDEATTLYARGMELVGELETYLQQSEHVVRKHIAGEA